MADEPKALLAAYKLLEKRSLSEQALREKLMKKGFAAAEIEAALASLKDKKYIDDSLLARDLADSRIRGRLLSNARVQEELLKRGLSKRDALEAVREAADDPESLDEAERALELVRNRARKMKESDPEAFKRKIFSYLAQRGYDSDLIEDVLNRYGRERE